MAEALGLGVQGLGVSIFGPSSKGLPGHPNRAQGLALLVDFLLQVEG